MVLKKKQRYNFLKNATKRNEILVLDYSELNSEVLQNIKNMFPNTEFDCNVDIITRTYTPKLAQCDMSGCIR